jgi:hypothetical protein
LTLSSSGKNEMLPTEPSAQAGPKPSCIAAKPVRRLRRS